jgi:hypothetical protein
VFGLPSLVDGSHEVVVRSGAILAVHGVSLDAFSSTFEVPIQTVSLAPPGSLIHQQYRAGTVTAPGVPAICSIELEAGQTLTVVVDPEAGLQATVELRDPSGAVVASAVGDGLGQEVILQTAAATSSGLYRVTFGSAADSVGSFTVRIVLNAAVEAEMHGGPANDLLASAQDLGDSFLDLGAGGSRGAVVGTTLVASEDFEAGELPPGWSTYSSRTDGIISVTGSNGRAPSRGAYALLFDSNYNTVLNEAVWTVDLSGRSEAVLSFWHVTSDQEFRPFDGDFTGHDSADGIAISADGVTWHPVWTASWVGETMMRPYQVDLAAEARAAGMALGADFQIKFQSHGDRYDEHGWDDIYLADPSNRDWYRFELAAGQTATLGLYGLSPIPTDATIELLTPPATWLPPE